MAMLKDPSKIQIQYPGNGRFFRYNETGSALYSGRTYQAWEEDETVKVLVRISCKEEDAPVFETDRSFMDNLENLLKIFPLEEWNGFSASMSGVMDGSHTGFTYLDREGNKTSFSNYAAVPAGFRSAYLMFSDLFEDLYYVHFPNPERTFGKYLDRQAANAGRTLGTGRYYALFAKGSEENELPNFQNGRIGSRILKFPKRFGVPNPGAVAACILRESSDSDPERYLYKVALSYHTSNEKGEGACALEIITEEDLFSSDSVTASAFTHDTLEKHYFGYFADKEYDEGEIERACKLVVYECTDHVIRPCGEAFVQIPRDKTGFGPESISDLIALAEACDLKKTAKDMTDNPAVPKLSIYEKNGFANIETLSENCTTEGVIVKVSSYA